MRTDLIKHRFEIASVGVQIAILHWHRALPSPITLRDKGIPAEITQIDLGPRDGILRITCKVHVPLRVVAVTTRVQHKREVHLECVANAGKIWSGIPLPHNIDVATLSEIVELADDIMQGDACQEFQRVDQVHAERIFALLIEHEFGERCALVGPALPIGFSAELLGAI